MLKNATGAAQQAAIAMAGPGRAEGPSDAAPGRERSGADAAASTITAIGARIRELRRSRGLTLQGLATAADLSASMLSLVERGRASPSIGTLVVIAGALRITVSDLIVSEPASDEQIVTRADERPLIETAEHVIRRILREDQVRGVSVALNEYEPQTGSASKPVTHDGFEYGYVLEGTLTVEVEGVAHQLSPGDLIAYASRRPHRFWNNGRKRVRTLWFNLKRA